MRVAFHTLGCKVNQYETEALKEAFVFRGATIVGEDEIADVYIINTCTVTNIADRKSRQYIRRMKSLNPAAFVVVTGCYAQVEPQELLDMEEVNLVIGNGLKSEIVNKVYGALTEDSANSQLWKNSCVKPRDELTNYEDMGLVVSSESGMTRAYIKIQEGCDRFCAYCLIPFARGPVRSRPLDEIVKEANMLLDAGYKELVLTGINTALYGSEEGFHHDLCDVLEQLNSIDKDFRIRLSSLEPTVVDKDDVTRIIKYDKLCHHLHLSVQSGSDATLKNMNRRYTQKEYLDIVRALRDFDSLYGITTDIIVGFSGETDEDFGESLKVVEQSEFGKVHIFRYSLRRGTAGEKLPDAVSGETKSQRSDELEKVATATALAFFEKNFGSVHRVLIEECVKIKGKEYMTGYTGNYIRVYIPVIDERAIGNFVSVRMGEPFEDGCLAESI